MPDAQDMDLVREFARHNSEAAFTELVRRHIALVYSVARRCTGNDSDAQDVTQAVFIILARKAAGLRERTLLPGWLYETTRFTATRLLRTNVRRQQREQEAYMQSTLNEADTADVWERLSPHLEDAMSKLAERDRALLVLRFYQNKSGPEAAALLGIREGAAHMRVTRAIEKLRIFFAKRGVDSTAATIAETISTHSVQAAPVALAKSVTAVAIAKGATASGSTLTLIKGALKIMAWTKAKTIVVAGAAVLFATGTTVVVVERVVSPSVNESFWELKRENLRKAPPVLIIRPTRYFSPTNGGIMSNTDNGKDARETIARNVSVANLLAIAFSADLHETILPPDLPTNNFDLMLTLRDHQLEALQKAIERKFGLTAHRETFETNELQLRVRDPELLAVHAGKRGTKTDFKNDARSYTFVNFPISMEARMLEGFFLKPVVLAPGLSGNYSLTFKWEDANHLREAVSNDLAGAGLELVPTNVPIEMLVVEKAK